MAERSSKEIGKKEHKRVRAGNRLGPQEEIKTGAQQLPAPAPGTDMVKAGVAR